MSKKTLIIIAALFGVLLSLFLFENTLSGCTTLVRDGARFLRCGGAGYTTTGDVAMIFLVRVATILVVAGGLLFMLREREVKLK